MNRLVLVALLVQRGESTSDSFFMLNTSATDVEAIQEEANKVIDSGLVQGVKPCDVLAAALLPMPIKEVKGLGPITLV